MLSSEREEIQHDTDYRGPGNPGDVMVKGIDGTLVKVHWKEIMSMAKEHLMEESSILQKDLMKRGTYPTATDMLTYEADEDRVLQNPVISALVCGLQNSQNASSAATLGNMLVKNAAPRYSSTNQLHLAQTLHNSGTSQNVLDYVSKCGVSSSRKNMRKIVLVDTGNFEDKSMMHIILWTMRHHFYTC